MAVQELRFGDNDTLSAHVAALVRAHWLFLMTDVDHLYTANPKSNPDATPIYEVRREDIIGAPIRVICMHGCASTLLTLVCRSQA